MKTFKYGAVASGHRVVSEIGLDILQSGGNAFDAIVACGFASGVCEPMLSSLGGGGFLMASPAQSKVQLFDFFSTHSGMDYSKITGQRIDPKFMPIVVNFPGSEQVFQSGIASAAVPGCVHGYLKAHQQLGLMPLREIMQPAIDLARNGVVLSSFQSYVHELLAHVILSTKSSQELYAKENGSTIKVAGDTIINKDLANFMEILAIEGSDLFYHGEVAQQISNDMLNDGGFVTMKDMQSYQTIVREPLTYKTKNYCLYGNPQPSFGSALIQKHLELIDDNNITGTLDADNQARWLASFKQLEQWRSNQEQASKNHQFSRGTTHVSVVDSKGNCASMTTSNGEGSGYVIPNTGIMLNNMMGEDDLHPHGFYQEPSGQRIASMMAPTIAHTNAGETLVLGSGGSKRIRSAISQVLWHTLSQKMSLEDAIAQPRMHYDDEILQCEYGYEQALSSAHYWEQQDMYFGGVHAVSDQQAPCADSRRGGYAISL